MKTAPGIAQRTPDNSVKPSPSCGGLYNPTDSRNCPSSLNIRKKFIGENGNFAERSLINSFNNLHRRW